MTIKEELASEDAFAGAGAIVAGDPMSDPAFYERVPVLEVLASSLCRGIVQHKDVYSKHKKFHLAEAGTYRGRGLDAMLNVADRLGIKIHITGLDSFEGLPPISARDQKEAPDGAAYLRKTLFADTTEREVAAFLGAERADSYTLVKGFFSDTLKDLPKRRYLFVVIDCDLYSSHMDCMEYFYNRLLPGGVMFFDDYHSEQYPMARTAVDEFLAERPEQLFHVGYADPKGNNVKTYIVKS
jgi:hypothetical protein